MNVTIKVNCDNAAFDEGLTEELTRIVNKALTYVSSDRPLEAKLFDSNGNAVGTIKVTSALPKIRRKKLTKPYGTIKVTK